MELPGRILVIGCGSVSQCTVPLLLKEVDVPPSSVTVFDMVDNRDRIAAALAAGVRYEIGEITPENLDAELSARLGPGDICLDLAWNIDTCTIVSDAAAFCACGHAVESHWEIAEPCGGRAGCAILGCPCEFVSAPADGAR